MDPKHNPKLCAQEPECSHGGEAPSRTISHIPTTPISYAFAIAGQQPKTQEIWIALLAKDIDNQPYMNNRRSFHHTMVGKVACETYNLTACVDAGCVPHLAYCRMISDLETWGA